MTTRSLKLFVLSIAVVAIACDKGQDAPLQEGRVSINNNTQSLNSRVKIKNDVLIEDETEDDGLKKGKTEFVLVAEVDPPSDIPGLSATAVTIEKDYAYVSYHIQGENYGGVIEVFDISNPANPSIISQAVYEDTDFNHLAIGKPEDGGSTSKGILYLAGDRDVNASGEANPAILERVRLDKDYRLTNNVTTTNIPSFSGNYVLIPHDDVLMISSGFTGGSLSKFDISGSEPVLVSQENIDGAKTLSDNGSTIVLLEGGPSAKIHKYKKTGEVVTKVSTMTIGNIQPLYGKSVIALDQSGQNAYVAMGDEGLKVFNVKDMENSAEHFANKTSEGSTNGVTVDNKYVYVANGKSGLFIYDLPKNKDSGQLTEVGNYNYDGSANFVASDGKTIFVANGNGGLKILNID